MEYGKYPSPGGRTPRPPPPGVEFRPATTVLLSELSASESPLHQTAGLQPVGNLLLLALLLATPPAQSRDLRIAWLSDTHVGSQTGAADLSEAVRMINADTTIDFTLLTGDVTEMGSDAELRLANSTLDSLRRPCFVVPGNHDTKWSESGCTTFPRLRGGDRFAHAAGPFLFIGMSQGPVMRMGDGHFAPEDLRWLDSVLAARTGNERVVFVTHYPLDRSIDHAELVSKRLHAVPTAAILCGHGHSNALLDAAGIPMLMGRSSLRRDNRAGGWNRIRLSSDSIVCSERRADTSAMNPWCAVPLQPYPPATTSPREQQAVSPKPHPAIPVTWSVETGWTITASPVIYDDRIIVGDRSGRVSCLKSSDGSAAWSVHAGAPVLATAAAAEGIAVVTTTGGSIIGLRVDSGTEAWRVETGHPIVAAPAISGSTVFVGSSEGSFCALDLRSGRLLWKHDGIEGFVETRPLVYRGLVVFGAWDTRLYALRTVDGTLAWSWSNGSPSRLLSPAACWPVASHGKIFIVAPDRAMTAIDAATGRAVWRSTAHRVRESIGLSADSSTVYARCMDDTLLAVSATASDFELTHTTLCGYGYDIDPSMPVESGGTVAFGTKNGLVFGVSAEDRTVRWVDSVGVTIVNTPAALPGGRFVVTDADGHITLLRER